MRKPNLRSTSNIYSTFFDETSSESSHQIRKALNRIRSESNLSFTQVQAARIHFRTALFAFNTYFFIVEKAHNSLYFNKIYVATCKWTTQKKKRHNKLRLIYLARYYAVRPAVVLAKLLYIFQLSVNGQCHCHNMCKKLVITFVCIAHGWWYTYTNNISVTGARHIYAQLWLSEHIIYVYGCVVGHIYSH